MDTLQPCIKCDSTNIKIFDCGYSSFNVGGGECRDCKHKVSGAVNINWQSDSLRVWNTANDLNALIAAKKAQLEPLLEVVKRREEASKRPRIKAITIDPVS